MVPESEMNITFARSGGHGGQNVNKVNTKAVLRWHVGRSAAFTEEQKALIRAAAGNRLNREDEVVIFDQTERSQPQNKDNAVRRLQELVVEALTPQKERKATAPSRAERDRRLADKSHQKNKKQERRWRRDD